MGSSSGFKFPVASRYVQFGGPAGGDPTDNLHYLKGWWSDGVGKTYEGEADIPSANATYHVNWQLDSALFDVDLSDEECTGKPITKTVSSWFPGDQYEVSYSNNVQPGKATLTVTGINGVVGTAEFTFNITGEAPGGWAQSGGRWWWKNADGSCPASAWKQVDGEWYWFDASGYMVTGWQKIGGTWYWFDVSGAMATGWQKVGGSWYYFKDGGAMATGWLELGDVWYHLDPSGAMATGWKQLGGSWYHLGSDGAMAIGWGWVDGGWYLFGESGAMKTGWQQVDGTWYYLDASGAMAHDRWVGNYYLAFSGAMATSQWIGEYWVGADGCWVPGASRYDTSAHQHSWATRTVTDSAAWDERVLVRAAYDEPVPDGSESVFSDGHVEATPEGTSAYMKQQALAGNNVSYSVKTKYRIVHHDAEYKTVHHDAVTHTETYCTICGLIW